MNGQKKKRSKNENEKYDSCMWVRENNIYIEAFGVGEKN